MDRKPVIVFLDDSRLNLFIALKVSENVIRELKLDIEIECFQKDEDAIQFIVENSDRIFMVSQDGWRPARVFSEKYLSSSKNIMPGSQTGAMSTFILDVYCPESAQIFTGGGFEENDYPILMKWAKIDARVTYNYMIGRKEALFEIIPFQLKRWLLGRKQLSISKSQSDLIPINEEFAALFSSKPNYLASLTPRQFEQLIANIFTNNGYKVELTSKTRDGGYDILAISSSNIENEVSLVEVKHYAPNRPVSVGIIRALYGVKHLHSADKAILVTSSYISQYAKNEFDRTIPLEIEFVERDKVLEWCKQYIIDIVNDINI